MRFIIGLLVCSILVWNVSSVQGGERLSRESFQLINESSKEIDDVITRLESIRAKLEKAKAAAQEQAAKTEEPKVRTDANGRKLGEHGYVDENGWTWDANRGSWWRYSRQQSMVWPQQNMQSLQYTSVNGQCFVGGS